MRLPRILPLLALVLCAPLASAGREHIEALSRSDKWQVRYCVPAELDEPTPLARVTLERLARDSEARVARQAFTVYVGLFVDVDFAIARVAFERGDFDQPGVQVSEPKVFRSADYWREVLRRSADDAEKATAVRALGLLRDTVSVTEISAIQSKNPYFLIERAVALHRLGSEDGYLETISAILDLSARDAVYYQTSAIDCLLQTHPQQARPAWERVEASIVDMSDLQPNWVYRHAIRKTRLP
jgi:hypothetical protein